MNEKENWATEDQMQAAFILWFNQNYPEYRDDLFSVPNGGARPKKLIQTNQGPKWIAVEGNKMVATGARRGVSDLVWILPVNVEFMELKLPGKVQQDDQIRFESRCTKLGHNYTVFYSLWKLQEFVKSKIKEYYGKV